MTLSILLALALATTPPCSVAPGGSLPASSSFADQLRCYQSSGRRVAIPGTSFNAPGNFGGGSCIKSVASDRFEVGSCDRVPEERTTTIPIDRIAMIQDEPRADYVTIHLRN